MSKVVSFVQIVPTIPQKTHLYCKYCLCRIDRALEIGEKSYGYEVQMGNSKLILCSDCLSALLPNKSFNRLEVLQKFEIERLVKLIRKFNSDSAYNPRGFGDNYVAFEDFEYLRQKYQTEYKEEIDKLKLNKQGNEDSKNDDWGDDFIPQVKKHGEHKPKRMTLRHLSIYQEENTPMPDEYEEEENGSRFNGRKETEEIELGELLRQSGRSPEEEPEEIIFSNSPPARTGFYNTPPTTNSFPPSPRLYSSTPEIDRIDYSSLIHTTGSSYYISLDNQG